MRRTSAVSLGVLALTLLAACEAPHVTLRPGRDSAGDGLPVHRPPGEPAYLTGTVVSVEPFTPVTEDCVPDAGSDEPHDSVSSDDPPRCTVGTADLGSVHINDEPGNRYGGLVAAVPPTAAILRATASGDYQPASFADLREGSRASLWPGGPVAQSAPASTTAAVIVIHR